MNCCPSNLLSGETNPRTPPYPVWISTLYTRIQCVMGGGEGVCMGFWASINTCRKVPLQVIFRWRHFALPSMSLSFLRPDTCENVSSGLSISGNKLLDFSWPMSHRKTWPTALVEMQAPYLSPDLFDPLASTATHSARPSFSSGTSRWRLFPRYKICPQLLSMTSK